METALPSSLESGHAQKGVEPGATWPVLQE